MSERIFLDTMEAFTHLVLGRHLGCCEMFDVWCRWRCRRPRCHRQRDQEQGFGRWPTWGSSDSGGLQQGVPDHCQLLLLDTRQRDAIVKHGWVLELVVAVRRWKTRRHGEDVIKFLEKHHHEIGGRHGVRDRQCGNPGHALPHDAWSSRQQLMDA
jgi:hypothetical protein